MRSRNSKKLLAEKRISEVLEKYQPQLTEIRKIVLWVVVFFVVGAGMGLVFNQKIIRLLISLFDLRNVNVVLTSPYQFVNLAVGVAIMTGLMAAIPVMIYFGLNFVRPALKPIEYQLLVKLIPPSLMLFIFGCWFGAKIEQFVVAIYSQTTTDYALSNFWDIENFLSQVLVMALTMGGVFQLPVIMTILMRLKIISREAISRQRRYVYVALTLFGVILPPTDVVSLLMIITPLFLLFEGTLLLNRTN